MTRRPSASSPARSKPSEATFSVRSAADSSNASRTPGSSNSWAPRTRNSSPNSVLPEPGPPVTRVARPRGQPTAGELVEPPDARRRLGQRGSDGRRRPRRVDRRRHRTLPRGFDQASRGDPERGRDQRRRRRALCRASLGCGAWSASISTRPVSTPPSSPAPTARSSRCTRTCTSRPSTTRRSARSACGRAGCPTSPAGPRRWAPSGPGVVTATFYNFSPSLVAHMIPRAWTLASPGAGGRGPAGTSPAPRSPGCSAQEAIDSRGVRRAGRAAARGVRRADPRGAAALRRARRPGLARRAAAATSGTRRRCCASTAATATSPPCCTPT